MLKLLAVLLVLFVLHGPVSTQANPLQAIDTELRAGYPQIASISAAELEARLDNGEQPALLDVRELEEFAVSHLAGAIRIDPEATPGDVVRAIGSSLAGRDVFVYCSVGVRSTELADRVRVELLRRGATRIANLSEGIFGWHNSGRPLVQGNGATRYVHPYDLFWGQLVAQQDLVAYTPVAPGRQPVGGIGFNESALRLGAFLGVFALLAIAESRRPRRTRLLPRGRRWFAHFGMLGLATMLVRLVALLLPLVGATAAALFAAQQGWGLFRWLDWSGWAEIVLAVLLLDLAIWAQHLATHYVPVLWRIHRVHHADRDLDASSALRFHPVEILLSAFYKLLVILALGPAIIAVIAFEVLLNACAMFNHANWALPEWVDHRLRLLVVTPDMHRIHHSVLSVEHNRNFGFCLSLWDRTLGTYKAAPDAGQDAMTIGLPHWQEDDRPARLGWLLCLPFRR